MKYVILQHPQTGERKFRFALLEEHDRLAAPLVTLGFQVRSAGFVRFLEKERFETFGESTSLKIGPHSDDAREISAIYSATLKTAQAAA